jgi:ATP-binding cassette, subfamily B, bacterial PglK
MIDVVQKCFDLVGRGRRLKWVALVLLALVVTAAEAVGAALVFLLLALITDPGTAFEGVPYLGDVRRFLPAMPDDRLIVVAAIAIAIFFVLRSCLIFVQAYVQERVVQNAGAQLATRMFRGYLAASYAFHLQRNSAELIRNSLQSVQSVINHAVLPVVRLISEMFVIVGLLAVLLAVAPLATAFAAGVLGPTLWLLLRAIHPRVKRLGKAAQQAIRDSIQTAQQTLEGIRDVKLLAGERYFGQEFARSRRAHARSLYNRAALAQLPGSVIESSLVLFIVAFLVFAVVTDTAGQGALSILGLFAYVGLRIQPSLRKVVNAANNLKFGAAAVEDVHGDLQRFEEAPKGAQAEMPFAEELRLEDVTFQYESSDRPALRHIELSIRPGDAIGICGPTGGGKSTLVDVVIGLLAPTAGRVLVDGRDLREDVRGWHQRLGVVSQSVFLLDGTLRQNISLGVENSLVDEARMREAVRLAQLDAFVSTLPEGLETKVGERGTRLSGGQRQRVAIARALYRGPDVLVFDEGTSALDNETEADLVAALEQLHGQLTIIMIAHRLSTVRRCDTILVIEDGVVSDAGTFDELAARHRLFAEFSA